MKGLRGLFSRRFSGGAETTEKTGLSGDRSKSCAYVSSMYELGEAKEKRGEMEEAIACWTRAILVARRQQGCHPETARALDNVGEAFAKQKRWDEALAAWNEALMIRKRHLNTDWHPEVARILNKIGVALGRSTKDGDHTYSALMAFEKALQIQQEILGPGHEDCAETTQNMFFLLNDYNHREEKEDKNKTTPLTSLQDNKKAIPPVA